jgi:branched-chain amino acid transport system substrate-binding protein
VLSGSSTDPKAKAFIESFTKKFNTPPDIWAAFAYDAMNLMIDAIKTGGESREKVFNYMTSVKDWMGATGNTTFDANGDVLKPPLKLIVKDGKFQLYVK